MRLAKNKYTKIKQALFFSFALLMLINALFYLFLPFKLYKEINISSEIVTTNKTVVWYVYKEKNSEKRIFSDRVTVNKNEQKLLKYIFNSNKEIDYIGLFWVADKGSSIRIKSYQYNIDSIQKFNNKPTQLIYYTSKGSIITPEKESISVQSTESKRNWIMLNATEKINKLRSDKDHRFLPVLWNVLLLPFLFFIIFKTKRNSIKEYYIDLKFRNIKSILFCFWCFIFPYWIVISHLLMAVISIITIIEFIRRKEFSKLFKNINISFILLYFWVVFSSFFTSSREQMLDTALDYSYFIFMPIVFLSLDEKIRKLGLKYFKIGLLSYILLIVIYTLIRKFELNIDSQFILFFKANLEIFWHTSYISAFLLIVFITNNKMPIFRDYKLILFYISSLIFMYIIDARIPFIVGGCLISYSIYRTYIKSKIIKTVSILLMIFMFVISIGFFLLRESPNKLAVQQNINNISNVDARISLWKASYEVIKKHAFFGVGNKNTIAEISNVIKNKTSTKFRNFNAHNQFIETFLSNGFLGFFFLGLIFFYIAKNGNVSARLFIFSCLLLFMVESYLQRQAGMIFFVFWYCYFLYDYKKINKI